MTASLNISAHLKRLSDKQPDVLAIACPQGRRTKHGRSRVQYKRYSYSELDRACDRMAHALSAMGVKRGMRTVLMVTPSFEFFALTFALFRMGAVPVMVDPGIGIKNLGVCLREAEPEAFVGIPKAHIARKLFGWARGTLKYKILVGSPPLGPLLGKNLLAAFRRAPTAPFDAADTTPNEVAAILFTSGSTGIPKGAIYTHGNFAAQVEMVRDTYGIEPGEIDLPTFPLFALFAPALGMSAIIPQMDFTRPGFVDPRNIIEAIHQFGCTTMFGSPALIRRVGAFGAKHEVVFPTLKRVISAGAPVPAAALRDFSSMLLRDVQVFTPYGATEGLPVASIGSHEILGETAAETAKGKGVCVGKPVDGVKVRIIRISDDPIGTWSDDLALPRGEIGEVVVQGPQVTREYYGRPKHTALAKIYEGENKKGGSFWHRMGDCGYFDEEGRLWFVGRKAHRVVTKDETLFSVQIEGVFNGPENELRTALVGVGPKGEQEPWLVVEDPMAINRREKTHSAYGAPTGWLEFVIPDLEETRDQHLIAKHVRLVLRHPRFPVDIRHNAKINREALARWAEHKLKSGRA